MTAGAESFASGLFTRFDLTFLVAEPTRKGVGRLPPVPRYAADYDVAIAVVGNKVHGADDVAFLRDQVGDDLLTWFGHSAAVRGDGAGAFPGTAGSRQPGRARTAAPRCRCARERLGEIHPPGGGIPCQECP